MRPLQIPSHSHVLCILKDGLGLASVETYWDTCKSQQTWTSAHFLVHLQLPVQVWMYAGVGWREEPYHPKDLGTSSSVVKMCCCMIKLVTTSPVRILDNGGQATHGVNITITKWGCWTEVVGRFLLQQSCHDYPSKPTSCSGLFPKDKFLELNYWIRLLVQSIL